jgi:hypothetical protein
MLEHSVSCSKPYVPDLEDRGELLRGLSSSYVNYNCCDVGSDSTTDPQPQPPLARSSSYAPLWFLGLLYLEQQPLLHYSLPLSWSSTLGHLPSSGGFEDAYQHLLQKQKTPSPLTLSLSSSPASLLRVHPLPNTLRPLRSWSILGPLPILGPLSTSGLLSMSGPSPIHHQHLAM